MISETELRERLERHFEAGDGVGCVTCCATAAIALVREVEAAHAEEVARLTAEREWQPMETAPKDGTDVDLGGTDGFGWDTVGRFTDGEWWELNNHPTDSWGAPLHPTHWRHRPAPPKEDR